MLLHIILAQEHDKPDRIVVGIVNAKGCNSVCQSLHFVWGERHVQTDTLQRGWYIPLHEITNDLGDLLCSQASMFSVDMIPQVTSHLYSW